MWFWISAFDASAGELAVWEREDFGVAGPLAGTDDWENGFAEDTWRSSVTQAYSDTDLGNLEVGGPGYGSGWAADNWLIRGSDVGQGGIEADFESEDDDAMAVVLSHDGGSTFYLGGFTRNDAPPPLGLVFQPTVFLIKVEAGAAFLVDEVVFDPGNGGHTLRLERDDDRVWVSLDGVLLIQANDPTPLAPGRAGLYAYNVGDDHPMFPWDEDSPAWFERVRVFASDEDDDLAPDDFDNCENVANADQLDTDVDGFGDACDESPGTTEPKTDADADADADADTDTDADADIDTDGGTFVAPDDTGFADLWADEDVLVTSACGCRSGSVRSATPSSGPSATGGSGPSATARGGPSATASGSPLALLPLLWLSRRRAPRRAPRQAG